MEKPKSYCDVVKHLEPTNVHKIYHDTSYGFPIDNDDELFERLILEINHPESIENRCYHLQCRSRIAIAKRFWFIQELAG